MQASQAGTWIMPSVTVTAAAATSTTTATKFPRNLLDACFVVKVSATFSGSSPLLDVSLETSPDNGTTYFTVGRFLQISAASVSYRMVLSFNAGAGNTASTTTNAGGGNNAVITSTGTGGLTCGCPLIADYVRFRYVIAGTAPSMTFTIYGWGNVLGRGMVTP